LSDASLDTPDDEAPLDPGVEDAIVQEAIDFCELSLDADSDNRKRGLYALNFAMGGDNQWDSAVLKTRRLVGFERPSDSYNQIPNFINQVANDARMNMTQTKFVPNEDGDKATAEKMEDLARNIQTQSDAEIAYDTAFYGQCVIGYGYWRYITEYENNKSFDQIIKVMPVENPFTIYDDPFVPTARQLERKRLLQATMMPVKDFNREYDKKYDEFTLNGIGDKSPGWATKDTVRVAEFWKVHEKKYTLYRNKKTGKIQKEKPANISSYDNREVCENEVKRYLITGSEVLETSVWQGSYIPYVKVVGQEVNIDGKAYVFGIVERMIPAQKQINYTTNAAIEAVALAPKSPWVLDPRGIANYQDIWNSSNTVNYAFLPYDSNKDGAQLPPPQRNDNNANLNSYVVLQQQAQQNMYNLSGIYPASLGQASNEKSGKAILARQREGDVATFHIHDNMSRGQRVGGRILADLMPKIYDASRKVPGKREDGSSYLIPLNQPYKDERTGKSVTHDLSAGTYDVAVTTGPSYTTKRQEAAEAQMQLVQAMGDLMGPAIPTIIRTQDWPSADKIAEAVERGLPPELRDPDQVNAEGKAPKVPPQVQAQLQQGEQLIMQLGQELQATQAQLQNKQAEDQLQAQQNQLKAAEIQLKGQELQYKQAELMVRQEEIQADVTKTRISAKSSADPMVAMSDPELQEGNEIPPVMQFLGDLSMTLGQGLENIAAITAQSSQAVIESNQVIAATNQQVAQTNMQIADAINRPKMVIRTPEGQVAGVQ